MKCMHVCACSVCVRGWYLILLPLEKKVLYKENMRTKEEPNNVPAILGPYPRAKILVILGDYTLISFSLTKKFSVYKAYHIPNRYH